MYTIELEAGSVYVEELKQEVIAPIFTGPKPAKYTIKYNDDRTRCWVTVIEE